MFGDENAQEVVKVSKSRIPRISLKPLPSLANQLLLQQQRQQLNNLKNLQLKQPLFQQQHNNLEDEKKHLRQQQVLSPKKPDITKEVKEVKNVVNKVVKPEVKEEVEEPIEDIDKPTNRDAIFLVSDIAKDIYSYLYRIEEEQSIREDYLKEQKVFTPKVRQRLINWCIDIHSMLNLLQETLYLTVSIIDQFFNKTIVKRQGQVQLAAVGAILIASKYEEIYPPDVNDLLHLTQNTYTRREVQQVEIQILETLDFNLGKPIPLTFLRRFSRAASCDLKMHSISKYLMELSLTEYECSHWRPSMLAAAALFTTIHLVHHEPSSSLRTKVQSSLNLQSSAQSYCQQDRWNRTLVHYTKYSRKQLQEPASVLCKILKRAQKSPQSFMCVKKNISNLAKWPELKSTRVDDLTRFKEQQL